MLQWLTIAVPRSSESDVIAGIAVDAGRGANLRPAGN
jgi:hypothetical protein